MIVTKEQREAWVNAYIKEKHTQEECIGFIDGIEKTLSYMQEKMKPYINESVSKDLELVRKDILNDLLNDIEYSC